MVSDSHRKFAWRGKKETTVVPRGYMPEGGRNGSITKFFSVAVSHFKLDPKRERLFGTESERIAS